MDQLEKMIEKFRDDIQNDHPNEGHFDRFEMKLNSTEKNKPRFWIGYTTSIAAILVVALLVFLPEKSENGKLTLSDLSEQYANVEFYYTSSINQQTQQIISLNEKMGNDQSIQLLVEELKMYDQVYDQLCTDLNAMPNDERVINALITYYQTKLEITSKILFSIEQKSKKSNNHENIEI